MTNNIIYIYIIMVSAGQKKNIERLKKIQRIARELRKKNKNLKQSEAVKQASKLI